jgi:hypothetical protein
MEDLKWLAIILGLVSLSLLYIALLGDSRSPDRGPGHSGAGAGGGEEAGS